MELQSPTLKCIRRQPITYSDKLRLIQEIENNPKEKKLHIAKRLGLAPSTLASIYANKNKIREHAEQYGQMTAKRKTCKESKFKDLETILFSWYKEALAENLPINGIVIREKAKEIAKSIGIEDFSGSTGWISRFKERHGLEIKKKQKKKDLEDSEKYCIEGLPTMVNPYGLDMYSSTVLDKFTAGEKCDNMSMARSSPSDSFEYENLSNWFRELPHLLEGYSLKDIYSLCETGLFYYCFPDSVLILKDEFCHDGKRSKERISVLLCSNCDGSHKIFPVIVGKSPKPRCFKNIKTLPLTYHSHTKSWFTKDILSSFLKNLDAELDVEKRKIILFLNDCEAHVIDIFLKNIKFVHFPLYYPKTYHPLAEVVKCFKVYYRKCLVKKAASAVTVNQENHQSSIKIYVLEAMHLIKKAWEEITQSLIANSFTKCGFSSVTPNNNTQDEDFDCDQEEWKQIKAPPGVDFNSYVLVDDNVFTSGPELSENSSTIKDEAEELEENGEKHSTEHIPTFSEAHDAFEIVKSFLYSHNLTEQDQAHITGVDNSLQSLNKNSIVHS